ncbi:MAG TPA: imidazolonepropionase [Acidimicrobiia bacterium]
MSDLVLTDLSQVVTNDPAHGSRLGIVTDPAIAIVDGTIAWVGKRGELPGDFQAMPSVAFEGRSAVPGFVDSHTHLVFGGDRAGEFGERLAGRAYEEILASGGGIEATVAATVAAATADLLEATRARAATMLAAGTTTVEIKSGYALDGPGEERLLEIAGAVMEQLPLDVASTYLVHTVPRQWPGGRDAYVEDVVGDILPRCAPLARFCDVFCDEGVFTVAETRRIVEAAKSHGLVPRLHACQLASSGGAGLAAEVGAASADHLDHVTGDELAAMEKAGTVAVLLPGVSFSMRLPQPDARRIAAAGVTIAIATDANPGTSYVLTMPFVIALATLEMGMSPDDALWSATRGGALALRERSKGWLRPGAAADIVVLDAPSHVHLAYRPDSPLVHAVLKDGVTVAAPTPLPESFG